MRVFSARNPIVSSIALLPAFLFLVSHGHHTAAADLTDQNLIPDLATPVESSELVSLDSALAEQVNELTNEIFTERYPDGKMRIQREVKLDTEGNYVNHGFWKMWNQDGTVVAEGQYEMDKRVGMWTRWIDRSQSRMLQQAPFNRFKTPFLSQVTFVDGKMNGEWLISDSDQKKCCQTSIKMGKRHGLKLTWLNNGKLLRQASFDNSVPVGDVLQLNHETGEPERVATYLKGRRIVTKTTNFRRGNQKQSTELHLAPTTVVKTADIFWNLQFAEYEEEGKSLRHGLSQHWHPNSQLAFSGQYDYDKSVGTFTYWYSNGHKASEGEFKNDQLHGTWVWWHGNGQKSAVGQYRDGAHIGQWRWWAENGKLTKQQVYDGKQKSEAIADLRIDSVPPALELFEPRK
jgi:antitoxin component YwqK of YwqJK toxin-antitoxin module